MPSTILERAFGACMAAVRQALGIAAPGGVVAVDGKSLRRGYDKGRAHVPPLMVSVWDCQTRLSLAPGRAPGGNEVAAILALLRGLVLKGCTVVMNYALCPQVSITEIVRQTRAALAWTWAHAAEFGADPQRISVSGHSAGGHLVARLLATAWQRGYGIPDDMIKAALPISGLFDLEPLRWSWLQPPLQLSGDEILARSPLRHLPTHPVPLAVAVGGAESAEFRRQSADYATAAGAKLLEVDGRHHFDVLDDLASPYGRLWRVVESLAG